MSRFQLPKELTNTLHELEGALSDWEKISPEPVKTTEREFLEKELQNKAKIILNKLKDQIDDLS